MMEHKVSVIVATYRRDETLKRALMSLLNQTYNNFEVIVVSDNADNEWNYKIIEIIDFFKNEFKNFKIKLILNDINLKSAETRNVGIKIASGEYITFLDDDDVYLPNKIEKQVTKMIEDNSDFSITNLELYNNKNKLVDRRVRKNLYSDFSHDELLTYHLKYHLAGTDTLMFKTNFLLEIGGFKKTEMSDEFFLMLRAIKHKGKFSYYDECYVHALLHGKTGGISSGKSKIDRENNLFEYKKKYFSQLSKKDVKYITSRHYATIAYAYLRMKKIFSFVRYSLLSFFASPLDSFILLFNR